MIKTIIKRNGGEEPFSAEKVNGWGEWASKALQNRVDWGEVVLHAVSTLPEKCTSEQLQQALIEFCIHKKTWEYNLMAGRLYYGWLHRILYGKKIPTVQALHKQMVEYGILKDMGYSDEEYAEIEKIINHKLDLKTTHFEIHQIRNKYALRDKVSGKEFETPQFVYMRMAMALSQFENDRLENVRKFYEHLSHKRINAPTPYYTNLGTHLDGYASCCVYTTEDTAPSLAAGDHIGYMMTVMSAGIGSHLKTRSLGDSIRKGLIVHQGKIPYYRALVGAVGANLQNGRGGAATVYYTAFDPEVEVIAKLKNPMTPTVKQVRGCDYSFGSNKFFAKMAALDREVALFSYSDAPELYEAQYGSSEEFEKKYNEFVASDKKRTMVPARKLLTMVLNEAYETGRHYLHFFDEMNTHTPFKDKIYSSNLCLTGDTILQIKRGTGAIEDIRLDHFIEQFEFGALSDVKVKSYDIATNEVKWCEISNAAKTATVEELYEIEDESGKIIKCTADHLIFTKNRGYVRAAELEETDVLCSDI